MLTLLLGLVLFFALHSIGLLAPNWRQASMARHGVIRWRVRYSMASLLAIAFIIMGFQEARLAPTWVWFPPQWTRHASALLMLLALFCVGSSFSPNSTLKSKMGYPLLLAVKLWAFAHLLSNGALAEILTFGSFLIWSIVSFAVYRRRDRLAGVTYKTTGSSLVPNFFSLSFAMISWFVIASYLHEMVLGVSPLF
ncbi:NnrU family protein [Marinomonas dokdonensis]|uniref:NnrU family protein n=1 Tax=Marinomonas dokdonensis TaxID=328224 RepID=UPI0040558239